MQTTSPSRLTASLSMLTILLAIMMISGCDERQKDGERTTSRAISPEEEAGWKIAEVYRDLRQRVLTTDADSIGMTDLQPGKVFMVLVDIGQPEQIVSVMATLSGESSLYLSAGGGRFNLGGFEEVNTSAVGLVKSANDYINQMNPTDTFRLPSVHQVRFHFRTLERTYAYYASFDELYDPDHPLSRFMDRVGDHLMVMYNVEEQLEVVE